MQDRINKLYREIGSIPKDLFGCGCFNCKHLNYDLVSCPAYPDQIPADVYLGIRLHYKKLLDQKGSLTFEKADQKQFDENNEKLITTKVIEKLVNELSRCVKLAEYSTDMSLVLGYKKGLSFAIDNLCKEYKIDIK